MRNTFDKGPLSGRKAPVYSYMDEHQKAMAEWIAFQQANEKVTESQKPTVKDQNKKLLLEDVTLAPGVTAELKEINNSEGRHVVCIVNGVAQSFGSPLKI